MMFKAFERFRDSDLEQAESLSREGWRETDSIRLMELSGMDYENASQVCREAEWYGRTRNWL